MTRNFEDGAPIIPFIAKPIIDGYASPANQIWYESKFDSQDNGNKFGSSSTKGIFMELRDYIEEGERLVGGRTALAKALGLPYASNLTNAKGGQRGLPVAACWKLAEIIGEAKETVTAASLLITEKDEGVREYLRPFVQAARHVQHLMIAGFAISSALMLAIENSSSTIRSFLL